MKIIYITSPLHDNGIRASRTFSYTSPGTEHDLQVCRTARRIARLIGEIQRDPFIGIQKREPLKGELCGYWSRRIDHEHRLVYRADDSEVKILKARYHY